MSVKVPTMTNHDELSSRLNKLTGRFDLLEHRLNSLIKRVAAQLADDPLDTPAD